jgi:hypothetical protein
MAVVGESFCQDHLRRISSGKLNDQTKYVLAKLVREPLNEFDANAVRIDVDGGPVGHLRRDDALELAPILDTLAVKGIAVECRVTFTGGTKGQSVGATLGLSRESVKELKHRAARKVP